MTYDEITDTAWFYWIYLLTLGAAFILTNIYRSECMYGIGFVLNIMKLYFAGAP